MGSTYIFSAHLRALFIPSKILTQTRNPQLQTASPGAKHSETWGSATLYNKANGKRIKGDLQWVSVSWSPVLSWGPLYLCVKRCRLLLVRQLCWLFLVRSLFSTPSCPNGWLYWSEPYTVASLDHRDVASSSLRTPGYGGSIRVWDSTVELLRNLTPPGLPFHSLTGHVCTRVQPQPSSFLLSHFSEPQTQVVIR